MTSRAHSSPESHPGPGDAIAVIGMAVRLAGATTPAQLWRNLVLGTESIRRYSDAELEGAGVPTASLIDPAYVKAGSLIDGSGECDAAFFGFSPREATLVDPQQRLFLECAWESLEDAGYDVERLTVPVGVFASASRSSYAAAIESHPELSAATDSFQMAIATDRDFLPTRASYKLGLRGPSVLVQTACSSSLVAVHLAVQSLRRGECRMALAGASAVPLHEPAGYWAHDGGILSPDGRCRAFDAAATGTVPGCGVGVVVLKRLEEALADHDHVYATILGSAVNNDGKEKIGYTAPSVDGQTGAIAAALASAGVNPSTVSYVEAHGTGTQLGDLIELTALQNVFGGTRRRRPCAIGSVKSNIGHVDVAAGVVGLIKTALALHHRTLPASLHYSTPHPGLDPSILQVQARTADWESDERRRASVSSFGIGGTNAHVVLEEHEREQRDAAVSAPSLVVLSARSPSALVKARERLAAHLREHADLRPEDVAFTLQHGRTTFAHRFAAPCRTLADAVEALDRMGNHADVAHRLGGKAVFMFPGQGPQYSSMASGLYETWRTFRETIDHCAELLRPDLSLDVRDVLLSKNDRGVHAGIHRLEWSLPAIFSVEYAITKLLESWSVRPAAMIGHSMGEYVAATIAGVFSLDDALRLVALRGRLMQSLPEGGMLAVPLPEHQIQPFLTGGLSLAAVNGPSLCVVSGPLTSVEAVERSLASRDVECQRLAIDRAAHSTMLDPIVASFVAAVRAAKPRAPSLPFISNRTGSWITPGEATDPDYWGRHLRETVRFADGIAVLLADPSHVFVEVGPGRMLGSLVKRQCAPERRLVFASMRHAEEDADDAMHLLAMIGEMWRCGFEVRWPTGSGGRKTPLPTYPFERVDCLIRPNRQGTRPSEAVSGVGPTQREDDTAKWFYAAGWRQIATPVRSDGAATGARVRWLLFADDRGVAGELRGRLLGDGDDVITIEQSAAFRILGPNHFSLNPAARHEYIQLLSSLPATDRRTHVAHLWSLSREDRMADGVARFESAQRHGFLSMVNLLQACEEIGIEAQRLLILTNGAHDIGCESTDGQPEQATVAGVALVAPREVEGIACQWFDVLLSESAAPPVSTVARQIHDEIRRGTDATSQPVAFRDGRRWTPTFEPCRLQGPGDVPGKADSGAYVVTGGLGGIGLAIAESLARKRAKLVLVGRSALPPRSDWDALLKDGSTDDRTRGRIRRLHEIEATGAEVLVATADVSDSKQMLNVVRDAYDRFGRVSGVIHAAGVAGGRMLHRLTADEARAVFAPKAHGLLVLERAFAGKTLDFFAICSAMNAFIGAVGLADYCGANAFLDAYADRMRRRGVNVLTVNWGLWRDVGMAVQPGPGAQSSRALSQGMSTAEGVDAFWRVVQSGLPRVAVSTQALDQVMRSAESVTATSAKVSPGPEAVVSPSVVSSVYAAPAGPVELFVAETWSLLLGVRPIGVHDNFFALGGHSLLGVQLLSRIRREFNIRLPMRVLFESPTIAQLAARVTDALIAGVEAMSDDEAARLLERRVSALAESRPLESVE
jgi:phthiocerol/phenolphthiocerol synthesis type-I polyketide synthase E